MDLERKYTEAEKEAINMSREMAGLGPLEQEEKKETIGAAGVETAEAQIVAETAEEIKERRNKNERRRIKQQGGLRPKQIFKYTLISWDGKPKDVVCEYPSTRQAIRYSKMELDPGTGKGIFSFADTVTDFYNDGLLPKFEIEDFPASEIAELATFLSEVVRNPFLK